jgi:hypothetical protein
MSDPSLSPSSRDNDPIDAEFEPADPTPKPRKQGSAGPGWFAFSLLALICLGMSAAGAGLIPGLKPGATKLEALQTDIVTLQTDRTAQTEQTTTLNTELEALKSRADNLQADRTRAMSDIRGLRGEIEALQADISALQRARIASLSEEEGDSSDEAVSTTPPDLSAIETRVRAFEDALVSQLADYDNALELLKTRVAELEAQASDEGLTNASASNARTEAALALSAIEAAARRGRPFLTAHQRLASAMPSNQAVQRLSPIAAKPIPTISDLATQFPALNRQAFDEEARQAGSGSSWIRGIFGDGIQVRREGETTVRGTLEAAETSLQEGDLTSAIALIKGLDPDLQAVFTDWLNNAEDRHMLEQSLEALRLTMIAEERP